MLNLPVAIILSSVIFAALVIANCGNYYTAAKLLRLFIRPIGEFPESYLGRTRIIRDIDYLSAFCGGRLDIYTSADATKPQPVLLWVHGGGYVGGDKNCIRSWAPVIACENNIAVVSVNYCLSPEQHYPTPLIQISEAINFLAANAQKFNLDLNRIFLGGDSAGSQISSQYAALVYSAELRAKMNLVPPVTRNRLLGIILCCGIYNMDTVLKSHFPAIRTFTRAYTDFKKISRYGRRNELSTVKNLGEGYCDVFITCGRSDPLLGQTYEMIDALCARGIATEFYLPQGQGRRLGHEFQFTAGSAEADTALRKTVEFIEQRK